MAHLRKDEWYVADVPFHEGKALVEAFHYSKGGSNTYVYMHGLYRADNNRLIGVAWWIPPTRVAAESVNREYWKQVLSLTRLALDPSAPTNSASFLLARSIKIIQRDGRFKSLVTYADESQGHTGAIYRASGWKYVGRTGPYPRWEDPATGRQVSPKATVNRTVQKMKDLGYVKTGSFHKHKFVLHLKPPQKKGLL